MQVHIYILRGLQTWLTDSIPFNSMLFFFTLEYPKIYYTQVGTHWVCALGKDVFMWPEIFVMSLSESHCIAHACVYLCLHAWLLVPSTYKWAHSNISQWWISWSMWRPAGYCQSAASRTWSKDNWSLSTRGTSWFVLLPRWRQADDGRPFTGNTNLNCMGSDWLGCSRQQAMHKWHS